MSEDMKALTGAYHDFTSAAARVAARAASTLHLTEATDLLERAFVRISLHVHEVTEQAPEPRQEVLALAPPEGVPAPS